MAAYLSIDGSDTHFGFVARRRWVYGQTYSVAHITMVEDFTEGGDISIPFRLPFEWVFVNLAALTMLFDRASELNNQGAWAADTGGSTPTNNTGPTANNALPFVHTETSGGNQTDHEDNGVLTAKDDTFNVIRSRDIVFRYAAYGDFAAGDGLVVQGRMVQTSTVEDAIVVDGSNEDIWRVNLSDPDDAATPYGRLGPFPSNVFSIRGVAVTASGDAIVILASDPLGLLARINLFDPTDTTGDYGLIGNLPTGLGRPHGIALDPAAMQLSLGTMQTPRNFGGSTFSTPI